jgi:putative nucleotidyltransferase with HDIG domain
MALPALALLTGSFTFRIPGSVVRLTVAEPIIFTATLLYGPAAGTVAAAIDAVAMSLRMGRHLRTAHRFAFNVALLSIAIWPASQLFFFLTGIDPRAPTYSTLRVFLGPLYLFAAGVFISNSALLAIALSFERGTSALGIWRSEFSWVATSYFASASVAALLVVYGPSIDLALIGVLAPLLLVSYLVFKTTVGRLDDANRHLGEVNVLYLSTIETLAMAIDAKDQVTHGHIRRVQKFAGGLAMRLGVDDKRQLMAIEAAALLHDMGKLAIPEFILNKPGRLTPGEFDVMKTHAAVGADILSAINFPYPVVPIVRHHHENWDGSGYPDGIRGPQIPVGARILSVVDCYDALTSDRPYRPAMSDDQAISILVQRRGTMYDPLVVDTFVREIASIKAEVERLVVLAPAIETRREHVAPPSVTPVEPTAREELVSSLRLLASIAPISSTPSAVGVSREMVTALRRIARFDSAAVYAVHDSLITLECIYADGPLAASLSGCTIPLAEQLSGWVGAHRTPVWNSDAALDTLVARQGGAEIASSMPLSDDGSIAGVLTLYAAAGREISVSQRRTIESLLPALGRAFAEASRSHSTGIDCRSESIRAATLAVLDSLLSHGRYDSVSNGGDAVLALAVRAHRGDATPIEAADLEIRAMELLRLELGRPRSSRVLIQLSNTDLLVYTDGPNAKTRLITDVDSAKASRDLQQVSIDHFWIDSSQALQDRARRIADQNATASNTTRSPRQVH